MITFILSTSLLTRPLTNLTPSQEFEICQIVTLRQPTNITDHFRFFGKGKATNGHMMMKLKKTSSKHEDERAHGPIDRQTDKENRKKYNAKFCISTLTSLLQFEFPKWSMEPLFCFCLQPGWWGEGAILKRSRDRSPWQIHMRLRWMSIVFPPGDLLLLHNGARGAWIINKLQCVA